MIGKVFDWLAYHASHSPERPAVIETETDRRLTYSDIDIESSSLASLLSKEFNVKKGSRVALLAHNCAEFLELEFSCLRLGAIFVPLNWRLTSEELSFIISDCKPSVLIFEQVFKNSVDKIASAGVSTQKIELGRVKHKKSEYKKLLCENTTIGHSEDISFEDVWIIMYTSGTTGNPKGAMITYAMTYWNAINLVVSHEISANMINLIVLPLFHTGGLNCYCNPAIFLGGLNIIPGSFDPQLCLKMLEDKKIKITHMMAVPTIYQLMSQHPNFKKIKFNKSIIFGVGGAPVPQELQKVYKKKGVMLLNSYGMTETSPSIAMSHRKQPDNKQGSSGLPVLHSEVALQDQNTKFIKSSNTIGEICVKGPIVTPGYYNNAKATRAAFTNGWFHTGDAGYFDDEGYLYIVDRWKDMYISGGENVYPAEIENIIYKLPQVAEVAVIGLPDKKWGESGKAIIVLKSGKILSEAQVRNHCRKYLAKYKNPKWIQFSPRLPHNATGKILKRELLKKNSN